MLVLKKIIDKVFPQPEAQTVLARSINYFWYAVGEILLIVIGIMLAINLNNYNEHKRQEAAFIEQLEIVYNKLEEIKELDQIKVYHLEIQEDIIDTILDGSFYEHYPENQLPYFLYYIDLPHKGAGLQSTNLDTFIKNLNPVTSSQEEIYNVLHDYLEFKDYERLLRNSDELNKAIIVPSLFEAEIPFQTLVFGWYANNNFSYFETLPKYSMSEVSNAEALIKAPHFIAKLKSLKSKKTLIKQPIAASSVEIDNLSTMIKRSFPSIEYQIPNIGIIGPAIDGHDWHQSSLDMNLVDEEARLFHIRARLKNGHVKFRADNMWKKDWGGPTFPRGKAILKGDNIPVKAGFYDIYINLNDRTYKFEKVKE